MPQYYYLLKDHLLFRGFGEEDFKEVLLRLSARVKSYAKNQIIRYPDTPVLDIAVVLEGLCYLTKIDYNGNRTILHEVGAGDTFGESLSINDKKNSPIIVTAALNTTVLFIPIKNIMEESVLGEYLQPLLKNIILLLSDKILKLQIKNDILSQKTTRDKLLLYFEYESKLAKSSKIKIRFSREELADFLCLNASAMSRELGKMRDEGILTFNKNTFNLKNFGLLKDV